MLANKHGIKVDEVYFVRLDKAGSPPEVMRVIPSWQEFINAFTLYKEYMHHNTFTLEDE